MSKGIYIGLGVLVIVILAGLVLSRGSKPSKPVQQAVQEPATAAATVTYTATGFSPSSVTVKSGSTVAFTNEGSEEMWVASDPHPIHIGLRGFDAKKGIGAGQTYSFTFTKTGTFGFHNHLNSSRTGTVVVE
ncbi:cupredoxin domain-containing protein [Candidatus Berkelbacteria bacterium]|nr:cupredoxin domain-containing protein [Candidatus Berkelbacteria bacterium]